MDPSEARRTEMTPQDHADSPVLLARITGALLLVMAVAAGFAQGAVLSALVVPGDAAATATKILASEGLFRAGVLGFLTAYLCDVPVAVLLYLVFRSAGATLALTMATFRLVYAAAVGAVLVFYLGAVLALGGAPAAALEVNQRQALAAWSLEVFQHGFDLTLVFFAFHLVLLGVLLWRSTLVPRVFGPLMGLAGVAYLVGSSAHVLAPAIHGKLVPVLAVPMMFELLLGLWLLVKGVRRTA